ncbi:ABC transporter substrate-binding protein [Tissierella praeacuta]|uniref:ABC transporter substrate-binding protein n=1 Tax=Tissierella praeacuta TaxID=43131 RepID=UPI0033421031
MKKRKKSSALLFITVISILVLVGCSKNNNSTANLDNPVSDTKETRIVSTVKGDVEVPINPDRILPTPYRHGDLIALGVMPVAIGETYEGAAFEDIVKDIPVISTWEIEEIMKLEPDLIFTSDEEKYDKLSKIAPTIFIPFDMEGIDRIQLMAKALGVEHKADKFIEELNNKIEISKENLEKAGLYENTFSIYEGWEGSTMMIVGNKWGRGGNLIYDFLQLPPNELVKKDILEGEEPYSILSLEAINQYAGDYIFLSSGWESDIDFSSNPVWNSIPAVQKNHIIPIDAHFFYYDDMYSVMAQIDYLVNSLIDIAQQ